MIELPVPAAMLGMLYGKIKAMPDEQYIAVRSTINELMEKENKRRGLE